MMYKVIKLNFKKTVTNLKLLRVIKWGQIWVYKINTSRYLKVNKILFTNIKQSHDTLTKTTFKHK